MINKVILKSGILYIAVCVAVALSCKTALAKSTSNRNAFAQSNHINIVNTRACVLPRIYTNYTEVYNFLIPGLDITENIKATTTSSGFISKSGAPAASPYSEYMILNIARDSATKSEILIGFNPGSGKNYNQQEDDRDLSGPGAPVDLWIMSPDGVKLVSKWMSLPKVTRADTVFLTAKAALSGRYTINRSKLTTIPVLYQIWLIDKYKKDSLDLRHNDNYTFDIDLNDTASFGSNRFLVITRQDPALGVHLLNFTGTKAWEGAEIEWKTENEADYTGFTVERSIDDGSTFTAIGVFLSSGMGSYSLPDKTPPVGAGYYRLKIQLVDSSIAYSKVVKLMFSNLNNSVTSNPISIYPNPASNMINLEIEKTNAVGTAKNHSYTITLISNTGYIVKTATTTSQNWQADITGLISGNYVVHVLDNNNKALVGKGTFIKL